MKKMLTPQQIFDKSVAHCIKQGEPAMHHEDAESCAYYNPWTHQSCAVGCFFDPGTTPQDLLDSKEGVHVTMARWPEAFEKVGLYQNNQTLFLLARLQHAHDCVLKKGVEAFKREVRHIARNYDLNWEF